MAAPIRIVFAGTPAVAVPALQALNVDPDVEVVAVITRPDAPIGRKRVLTPSPVAEAASALGLRVIRANRLGDDVTREVAAANIDLGVIVAYGGLVREPLLSTPYHGWINLHFSALPAWRGAAPVQRALMNGETTLGTAVFRLVPELDAGDVFDVRTHDVGSSDTAGAVLDRLAVAGAAQIVDVVHAIAAESAQPHPQTGTPSFAPKLTAADGLVRWDRAASEIVAHYRGVTPEPGAFTENAAGRIKIVEIDPHAEAEESLGVLPAGVLAAGRRGVWVGTSTTPVLVTRVQPSGKKPMSAADWFRGTPDHRWGEA